jgi:hypothetical protein
VSSSKKYVHQKYGAQPRGALSKDNRQSHVDLRESGSTKNHGRTVLPWSNRRAISSTSGEVIAYPLDPIKAKCAGKTSYCGWCALTAAAPLPLGVDERRGSPSPMLAARSAGGSARLRLVYRLAVQPKASRATRGKVLLFPKVSARREERNMTAEARSLFDEMNRAADLVGREQSACAQG